MGRRVAESLPQMRLHKPSGRARVRIGDRTIWLGQWGTASARLEYDRLITRFIQAGRVLDVATADDDGRGQRHQERAPRPAAPRPAPLQPAADRSPAAQPITNQLTVAELALAWLADIERRRPGYKSSSEWQGAMAAARAIEPFGTMSAAQFGSRALVEVQQHLAETPLIPKRVDAPPKMRSRRYLNDTIQRIRQMFRWAVLRQLVPEERVHALDIVPPVAKGQTIARETKRRVPVKRSVYRATLPHLTGEMAALVQFIRLTGCRPSEATRMRVRDIRDRDRPVWRYCPRKHKTAHMGKQRHIAIGPQAREIVAPRLDGRDPKDYVFTPQRSVRTQLRDGKIKVWTISHRVGRRFTVGVVRVAVRRAVDKANAAARENRLPEIANWTPYQLRYLRLREVRRRGGREEARSIAGHARATMTDHYAPAGWGKAVRAALRDG